MAKPRRNAQNASEREALQELDIVALRVHTQGLAAGTQGTIVHAFTTGDLFVVEFCDAGGRTLALIDVPPDALDLIVAHRT